MKCNQPCPGFELVSPCPFPTTITITPRALHCLFIHIGDFVLNARGQHQIWLGQFECVSWSFTVHFGVHMYSSNLDNRSLFFLFKLPQLFDCGWRVHFNFHLFYIFKFVFSLKKGVWIFFFFLCSWNWSISIFCSLCFILLVVVVYHSSTKATLDPRCDFAVVTKLTNAKLFFLYLVLWFLGF